MKKLLILMLLMVPVFAYTQDQVVPETTITEAERIIDKYSAKVASNIMTIVSELQEPAKEVFVTVTKLQFAKGVAYLVPLLLFLITFCLFIYNYRIARKESEAYNKGKSSYQYDQEWSEVSNGPVTVILLVASCCLFIGSVFSTYWGILYVCAPEWFAIMELVNLVK